MTADLRWWGWGRENICYNIAERPKLIKLLTHKFGIKKISPPHQWHLEQVSLPPSRLNQEVGQKFIEIFGEKNFEQSHEARVRHTYGKSYRDLIRMRTLTIDAPPDAVVFAQNEGQIILAMEVCRKYNLALMPFGGGSSVVGGLEPLRGLHQALIVLDMTRMNRLKKLDTYSMTAEFEAGIYGPELEKILNTQGLTLGHFPQSFEFSTLGGWLAARSSGQNSMFYGSIHKMATSLRLISPQGELQNLTTPSHACGPDLKEILIGSEGGLGVITSAVMKVHPIPEEKIYFMLVVPSFAQAIELCREVMHKKIPLALMRVSDEDESSASLATAGRHTSSWDQEFTMSIVKKYFSWKGLPLSGPLSLMLIGIEGSKKKNKECLKQLNIVLKKHQALSLGKKSGDKWLKERFFLPYMRDELIDQGLFVETLETVTTWSNLKGLYQKVRSAILSVGEQENLPTMVLCHISHPYHEGASLYFTIIARQKTEALLEQWHDFKQAANAAIISAGGAISHHHGVGVDHIQSLAWNKTQKELMSGMKQTLDPEGLMNPGKLFPTP